MNDREMAEAAGQLRQALVPTMVELFNRSDVGGAEAHAIMLTFTTDLLGHVLSFYDLPMREQLLETLVHHAKEHAARAGGSVGLVEQYIATRRT